METNPTEIDFPMATTSRGSLTPMDVEQETTVGQSSKRRTLPRPPAPSTTAPLSMPLSEDKYHGWVDLNKNQLLHIHAWHIPKDAMENYMKYHVEDPDVYVDFTTYYREAELYGMYSAYGGLLNGPTWARFTRWWHRTNRTYTSTNPERAQELQFELANYLDEDGWNYINGISHGCTKFVSPDEIAEHRELNYLILQACNYYELCDKEKWTSPLLTALRAGQALPTTTDGKIIAPDTANQIPNYQAIDTMVDFGTKRPTTMQEAWMESVSADNTNQTGTIDLRTTLEMMRKDVTIKPKRSRL